jgi:plastocyanin
VKYSRLMFGAMLLLLGSFVLAFSVRSFADDKDGKAAAKDVKFACSQHGPTDMQLTLTTAAGTPARKIEFIGGDDTSKWVVKIDGAEVTVDNAKTVDVRSGDTITWSVASKTHGVAFAEQDLAQALLEFDTTVGKPLVDQTTNLSTTAWKMFGTKRWGTDPTREAGVLASCKVKY